MKKILTLLFMGAMVSHAQTLDDIELFNISEIHGTGRYVGMGGAFTSLGNDLSSLHLNPAGAGVYRNGEFGISLGILDKSGTQSGFFGGSSNSTDYSLNLENIGFLTSFDVGAYKKERKLGFGITYQKLADFDRDYSVTGKNALGAFGAGSLAGYWLNRNISGATDVGAIGLMGSELQDFGLDEELAAFQANILVASNDTLISDVGFGNSSTGTSNITYFKDENGSHNELAISFGGQASPKFYYGVSLGFPILSYRLNDEIREFGLPNDTIPFDGTSYTLNRTNDIYGAGFNVKLGFIFKPVHFWRIGGSYQTPSWYSVNQVYEFSVSSTFADGSAFTSDIFSTGEYSYRLRTPAIYRIGTSVVIGKRGIISADYEYSDPSRSETSRSQNINGVSDDLLTEGNDAVSTNMTDRRTIRVGGELRLGLVSLRAGYSNQTSFYDNPSDFRSGSTTISGGIAYQTKKYGLNLTLSNTTHGRKDWVHPFAANDLVTTDITQTNIILGAQFRF